MSKITENWFPMIIEIKPVFTDKDGDVIIGSGCEFPGSIPTREEIINAIARVKTIIPEGYEIPSPNEFCNFVFQHLSHSDVDISVDVESEWESFSKKEVEEVIELLENDDDNNDDEFNNNDDDDNDDNDDDDDDEFDVDTDIDIEKIEEVLSED